MLFLLPFVGCKQAATDQGDFPVPVNPAVKQLVQYCPGAGANHIDAGWKPVMGTETAICLWGASETQLFYNHGIEYNTELGSSGIARFRVSGTLDSVLASQVLLGSSPGRFTASMALSPDKTKLLAVLSRYYNSSRGALYEVDAATGIARSVLDSAADIVSARYLPDGAGIIYYRASETGVNGGFYYHNLQTGDDSLVLACDARNTFSPGFDLRPDGRKIVFSLESPPQAAPPPSRIVGYDLAAHTTDTLAFAIEKGVHLWLRYSHAGTRLLYCAQYPGDAASPPASKVGIVDLVNQTDTPLNIRTNPGSSTWPLAYNPEWNSDDTKIIFSGGYGSGEGNGALSLYVLTGI